MLAFLQQHALGRAKRSGIKTAHNYSRYSKAEVDKPNTEGKPMTATFPSPLSPDAPNSMGIAELKAAMLEPLLVVAVSLFWIAVLPVTAVVCAGVAIYDRVAAFKSPTIRLPTLARNLATNPPAHRRKCLPVNKTTNQPGGAAQSAQA